MLLFLLSKSGGSYYVRSGGHLGFHTGLRPREITPVWVLGSRVLFPFYSDTKSVPTKSSSSWITWLVQRC